MNPDKGGVREVIPRWRPFAITSALRELGSVKRRASRSPADDRQWRQKISEWQREHTLAAAWSVIEFAVVENRPLEATDAAEFVLSHREYVPVHLRRIAESVTRARERLQRAAIGRLIEIPAVDETNPRSRVKQLRDQLGRGPGNVVAWVDMALAYCNLGQIPKAQRAMRIALALAPNNRFVLRAAARFYIHADELDRAHDLIRRAPSAPQDPWLTASEIAIASMAGRQPRLVKTGRSLVFGDNFAPFELAELTAALGTLELNSGSGKSGKRLLQLGLAHPNDNSLAQVEWADRIHKTNLIQPGLLETPLSFEARTWDAYVNDRPKDAVISATSWATDESFSTQPWNVLTYLYSCVTHEYDRAIEAAQKALTVNPDSNPIMNNFAIALARKGEIEEAASVLSQVKPENDEEIVTNLATRGLVEFRTGRPERGRALYEEAIGRAAKLKNGKWLAYRAWLYLSCEEAWAAPSEASAILQTIEGQTKRLKVTSEMMPLHVAVEAKMLCDSIRDIAKQPPLWAVNSGLKLGKLTRQLDLSNDGKKGG